MKTDQDLKTRNIRAILFDMDGVLVDSMAYHLRSWKDLLENYEITVSDEFIYEHEGALDPDVIIQLFNHHGQHLDPEKIMEIYRTQNTLFQERYLDRVNLFPHSLNLLTNLNEKGFLLGLVTSSRRNLVEQIWQAKDLQLFDTVVTADDITRFKPFPDPYLKAMTNLNQTNDRCLVIENAPAGIQSANSAGMTCLAIASTLPAKKLSSAQLVFSNLSSLNDFLENTLS